MAATLASLRCVECVHGVGEDFGADRTPRADPLEHVGDPGDVEFTLPGQTRISIRRPSQADPLSPGTSPRVSEESTLALIQRGVQASVVRLPQVHDHDRHGLASYLIAIARTTGVSAYVGDGLNLWSAVHRLDAAPVYRLTLEQSTAGARYHAVAETGVTLRRIAEVIRQGLGVPVVSLASEAAPDHFGGLAFAVGADLSASGTLTEQQLGWRPEQAAGFLEDLERSTAYAS